jgi:hypothetical protein
MIPVLGADLLPVSLPDVIGVTLGTMVVLIPVLGATIRFAAKPLVDALRSAGVIGSQQVALGAASSRDVDLLSRRVLELEQEVAKLKGTARVDASIDSQLQPVDRQPVR